MCMTMQVIGIIVGACLGTFSLIAFAMGCILITSRSVRDGDDE